MRSLTIASIACAVALLAGCGGTSKSGTSKTPTSATGTSTPPAASTPSIAIAQDKNPGQTNYWPPQYENGLVSACVNNKITPTESMCNCIVAALQSHHPALAESPADRNVVEQWMTTASGDPFSLHEYALNCSSQG